MNFKLKYMVLPALLTALAGCDSDSNNSEANFAPVLANPESLETEYSTLQEIVDISTGLPINQLQYTFQESDMFENGSQSYTIDLLKGFTDSNGDLLTVENFQFVWVGPDCSDTLVAAPNYPELCTPVLAEFGLAPGDDLPLWDVREDIRDAQGLPKTDEVLYGFELKQTELVVTPREFAPVLFQDELAVVNISFDITDGVDSITHYIHTKVVGENVAPEFFKLADDGSPLLNDKGNIEAQNPHVTQLSEKNEPVTVDLLMGFYDADIFNNQEFSREVGNLDEYYVHHRDTSYTQENLTVVGVDVLANITFEGIDASGIAMSDFTDRNIIRDPFTDVIIGYELTFDPAVFAEQLAKGDTGTIVYNFEVTDGQGGNTIARTATFEVVGANLTNPPEFSDDLAITLPTNGDITTIDLFDGVFDAEGDEITLADFISPAEANVFGISASESTLTVDPYAFLYLEEGESEVFVFTYTMTDGVEISEERTLTLTINGSNSNLIVDGTFESGNFDNGWAQQLGGTDGTAINAAGAYTGSFGVEVATNDSAIRATKDAINQNRITENDDIYLTWQSSSRPFSEGGTGAWTNVVVQMFDGNSTVGASAHPTQWSTMRGTYEQVLHTVDYSPSDFFSDDTPIMLQFTAKSSVTIDDVSLVKYTYTPGRNLIGGNNGHFNQGSADNWGIEGVGASLAVTNEASNIINDTTLGLEVTTPSAGESWGKLTLQPEGIRQGTLKSGIRYVVELDFLNHTGADGIEGFEVKLVDGLSGNWIVAPENRFSLNETTWQNLKFHFVTDTDSVYGSGSQVSDPDFDWSTAEDIRLEIGLAPGKAFSIDDVRFYPVPE